MISDISIPCFLKEMKEIMSNDRSHVNPHNPTQNPITMHLGKRYIIDSAQALSSRCFGNWEVGNHISCDNFNCYNRINILI